MPKLHMQISCEHCDELYFTNEQTLARNKKMGAPKLCKACRLIYKNELDRIRCEKYREAKRGFLPTLTTKRKKKTNYHLRLSFADEYNKRTGKTLRITK